MSSNSFKKFCNVYTSLINTLVDTFPSEDTLQSEKKKWDNMNEDARRSFIERWYMNMQPHESWIEDQSCGLFGTNLPVLLNLRIPQLWVNQSFTTKSQEYLWIYLQSLYDISKTIVARDDTISNQQQQHISPPPMMASTMPAMPAMPPNLEELCRTMSPELLQNATSIAENIATKLQSRSQPIEQMSLPDIIPEVMQDPAAQKLFASLLQQAP